MSEGEVSERNLIIPVTQEPVESQLAQLRRWLEGFVDDKGERHPGLVEVVGELYGELKDRRERREAVGRVLASGSLLAVLGFVLNWLKDHLR